MIMNKLNRYILCPRFLQVISQVNLQKIICPLQLQVLQMDFETVNNFN